MCGIIGYIGDKKATPVLINGLLCLEYRGYDSAGIAVIENGKIAVMKDKGRVSNLEAIDGINDLTSTIGIAHTRWATHGNVTEENAHPHQVGKITLVHNGIIENADNFEISIENTGTHIPEEELDNIFIKFYKLDKSGDRSTNSFGLGLAIVQRILELHNSTFSMTNSLNGVLFKFTLSKADDDNLN